MHLNHTHRIVRISGQTLAFTSSFIPDAIFALIQEVQHILPHFDSAKRSAFTALFDLTSFKATSAWVNYSPELATLEVQVMYKLFAADVLVQHKFIRRVQT